MRRRPARCRISKRSSSPSAPISTTRPDASRERTRSSRFSRSSGGRSAATTTCRPASIIALSVCENSAWVDLPCRNCRSSISSTSVERSNSLKASVVWVRSDDTKPNTNFSAVR